VGKVVNRETTNLDETKAWNFQEALPRLQRCILALTAGTMEPLRAEMFARAAIKSVLARKLPVSTTTYLRMALYQAVIAECRRFQTYGQTDISLAHSSEIQEHNSSSAMLTGFACLSQDERDVLVLVAIEEFSHKDAAQILDLPVFALIARLTRAREHLQAELMRQHRTSMAHRHTQSQSRKMAYLRLVK